jgi:hypothetical protein
MTATPVASAWTRPDSLVRWGRVSDALKHDEAASRGKDGLFSFFAGVKTLFKACFESGALTITSAGPPCELPYKCAKTNCQRC